MTSSERWWLAAGLLIGFVIGSVVISNLERKWGPASDTVNAELVQRGHKQYSQQTGELEWVEATK